MVPAIELGAFKRSTRIAYYIISAGILFYALIQLGQFALVLLLTLVPSLTIGIVVPSLVFAVPFVLSAVLLYVGVRNLARLLSVQSRWMSIPIVLAGGVVLAGASVFIPHVAAEPAWLEHFVKALFAIASALFVVSLLATMIASHIRDSISSSYRRAMGWLVMALAVMTLATAHEIIFKDTNLLASSYISNGFASWPFLLAGLLFMGAGQAFREATFKRLPENSTYLDAVVYAASLVSNPQHIDKSLDRLRVVTSRIEPGSSAPLPAADKAVVMGVYREVEDYLVSKEPLLKLTREGLRARLTTEFQEELEKS